MCNKLNWFWWHQWLHYSSIVRNACSKNEFRKALHWKYAATLNKTNRKQRLSSKHLFRWLCRDTMCSMLRLFNCWVLRIRANTQCWGNWWQSDMNITIHNLHLDKMYLQCEPQKEHTRHVSFQTLIFHKIVHRHNLSGGKIFNNSFIANLQNSATVKKLWKLVNIWQRYEQECTVFFPDLRSTLTTINDHAPHATNGNILNQWIKQLSAKEQDRHVVGRSLTIASLKI